MKPPPRKESEIQREILRYLQARGIFAWKAGTGGMRLVYKGRRRYIKFGMPGVSDIIGLLPSGRFLAIEVKRPGKRATREQAAFLAEVSKRSGLCFIADSAKEVHDRLIHDEALHHGPAWGVGTLQVRNLNTEWNGLELSPEGE